MTLTITIIITIITVITSLLALSNEDLRGKLIFNPYIIHKKHEWWRFFTSGFIHADFMHLAINMLVFYSFGNAVESYFAEIYGAKAVIYFIFLYLGGLLISSAPTYAKNKNNYIYNSLGASGAVAAILFAAILFNPWNKIYIWGVIGIPGIILGPLYLFYEYRSSRKGGDNINHDAHFWGAVFGLVFPILLKPSLGLDFISNLVGGPGQ